MLSTKQRLAIIFESETAASLLGGGLRAVARRSGSNDELHLPMQLLSQGLERLLKLTWALGTLHQTGSLPGEREAKVAGHDLLDLESMVLALARSCDEFYNRELIREEDGFVTSDPVLRAMLKALSDFARIARYRDLDLLLRPDGMPNSPDFRQEWSQLEMDVLKAHPEWPRLVEPSSSECYPVLADDLVARLQRYVRFMCFMWTLGPLGALGRQYSVPFGYFIHLRDDAFARPPVAPLRSDEVGRSRPHSS